MALAFSQESISSTGSSVAVARYARAGLLPAMGYVRWTLLIGIAIAGGAAGAVISQLSVILVRFRLLIPVLLVSVMIFLVRKWFFEGRNERVSNTTGTLPRSHPHSAIVGLIAGYDGLFGPGTGTFFLSWLEGLGHPTVEANAMTKVFNLSSNIGALAFFALRGKVIWPVGLACAAAIMMGNFVGSSLVLKRGKNIVRGTVLLVTSALLVRYFISF